MWPFKVKQCQIVTLKGQRSYVWVTWDVRNRLYLWPHPPGNTCCDIITLVDLHRAAVCSGGFFQPGLTFWGSGSLRAEPLRSADLSAGAEPPAFLLLLLLLPPLPPPPPPPPPTLLRLSGPTDTGRTEGLTPTHLKRPEDHTWILVSLWMIIDKWGWDGPGLSSLSSRALQV